LEGNDDTIFEGNILKFSWIHGEDYVSFPEGIRTGHCPMPVTKFITGTTVVGQPTLMISTVKGLSFYHPWLDSP